MEMNRGVPGFLVAESGFNKVFLKIYDGDEEGNDE